jgi:hypothetical protein
MAGLVEMRFVQFIWQVASPPQLSKHEVEL